jgi:hypothetical protein
MANTDQKGTEEEFYAIVKLMADNAKAIDEKRSNNNTYQDQIDKALANNHWGKRAFFKELSDRVGILGMSMRSVKKLKEPKEKKS